MGDGESSIMGESNAKLKWLMEERRGVQREQGARKQFDEQKGWEEVVMLVYRAWSTPGMLERS